MPNTSNEQLWLRQLRWKELAQDPCWDPLTFSPEGVHWEKYKEAFGYHQILQN
jgi:hypothetical protein